MHKINTAKVGHLFQRVLLLILFTVPLLGFIQPSTVSAATTCPAGQSVAITGGTLCQFSGEVTCSTGYVAQYNGSSMVCTLASEAKAPATNCPAGQSVAITGGALCQFSGEVTCNPGYVGQYNGSSMVCAPATATCPNGTTVAAGEENSCPVDTSNNESAPGKYFCGGSKGVFVAGTSVNTSINFGCSHKGGAILDMIFAIIRFLSTGVGIVVVGSMIWAGIQYTMSRGDPQAVNHAIERIRSNVWALLLFIFAYAILDYLIPGAFLK